MEIKSKSTTNLGNSVRLKPIMHISPSSPQLSNFKNINKRPLETNSQNLSFKGLSSNVSKLVKTFEKHFGKVAAEDFEKTIDRLSYNNNFHLVKRSGNEISFKTENFADRLHQAITDPILYMPHDLANATLNGLKKIPFLKNSESIDNLLNKKPLKNRKDYIQNFADAKAVQHYVEMFEEKATQDKKFKNEILKAEKIKGKRKREKKLKELNKSIETANDKFEEKIFKEGLKRLNPGLANYSTKVERTITRIITGIIPGIFLAKDAYNLSIYMNDDKNIAKKEKQRRFNQEATRIVITAASTFAVLGLFAKKSNSNPRSAMYLMAATTLASEVIGRAITGMPFYPISAKNAEKYAEKRKQKELEKNKNGQIISHKKSSRTKATTKKESKASEGLKLLGALILIGFGAEHVGNFRPLNNFIEKIKGKYKNIFIEDYKIKRKDFDKLIDKLEKNGYPEMAKNYRDMAERIIKRGNLPAKDAKRIDKVIDDMTEKKLGKTFVKNTKEFEKIKKKEKKHIEDKLKQKIMKDLDIKTREGDEYLYITSSDNKIKDIIINQVLGLPFKFGKEVVLMPYTYVVKPLIELPKSGIDILKGKVKPDEEPPTGDSGILKNSIEFLKKLDNTDKAKYQAAINKGLIESFDNVTKSNFSNAELSGAAKTAVSTVTSTFLIFDNYNTVMMDSNGKDKDLAGQKAKERTIQRIVRIAYGVCLIKLFNGIFRKQYDGSLLGAQGVNIASTGVVETMERVSVGLPLHDATREEIVEKDEERLKATGLKGAYFRYMAKLTGKKSLSEMSADKK